MFEVGFTEIILILGIALLVLGPEKLPKLANQVGRWAGRARVDGAPAAAAARRGSRRSSPKSDFDPQVRHPSGTPAAGTPKPTHPPAATATPATPAAPAEPASSTDRRSRRPAPAVMSATDSDGEKLPESTLLSHLIELRTRMLRSLLAVVVLILALMPFANDLYTIVAAPLMAHLPEGSTMIATEVATPFIAPFKLAVVVAVFIAMPFVLYQVWAFVAPGLYRHEQGFAMPMMVASGLLFYLGAVFAYFAVFPLVFSASSPRRRPRASR